MIFNKAIYSSNYLVRSLFDIYNNECSYSLQYIKVHLAW